MIPIDTVKQYVRLDDEAETGILETIEAAAEDFVIRATGHTREELEAMSSDGQSLPMQLQQAILMVTADWYDKRSATTMQQAHTVPLGVTALIRQFRTFKTRNT